MDTSTQPSDPKNLLKLIVSWAFVGIPFAWGVWLTVKNAAALFH